MQGTWVQQWHSQPQGICVDCRTWSLAWVLRFVFCLSPCFHSIFLHFLSLSIFVCLPRGTTLAFNGDRENICLFSPTMREIDLSLDVF